MTSLLILYYVVVSVIQSVILNKYAYQFQRSAVNSINPEMYNVTTDKLNVLTRLGIFNNSAAIDLDQYVGGVYSMHSMNNTGHQTKFFKAVNCTELHPNASESMKSQYEGYKCPDLDSYLLQGN